MTPAGKTPVIAIVDDEEMVLTSLRSFLTLETDFDLQGELLLSKLIAQTDFPYPVPTSNRRARAAPPFQGCLRTR